jgi:formamidopyrimidine-DNA glycosylase
VELPEVEVLRRDLEKDVVGRRIAAVEVKRSKNSRRVIRRHKAPKEFRDRLVGRKITKVDRRGKYVLFYLDNGEVLVAHMGMSGRFLRGTSGWPRSCTPTSSSRSSRGAT